MKHRAAVAARLPMRVSVRWYHYQTYGMIAAPSAKLTAQHSKHLTVERRSSDLCAQSCTDASTEWKIENNVFIGISPFDPCGQNLRLN